MAELLIAAAEECKCNNQEMMMDSENKSGIVRSDFTDSNVRTSPKGVCVCVCRIYN